MMREGDQLNERLFADSESSGRPSPGEPSLEEVVRLLGVARQFFGVAGIAFLLWKADELLRKKEKGTITDAILEIALVSVLGPGLVWVTSKWGERLAKEASESHEKLVVLNKLAQEEITERRRAEEALAEVNAQLEARVAERTRELTELNDELKREIEERQRAETALVEREKLAATGRMAAQMAHEINNPLGGIKNAFRLLRDAVAPDHPDVRYVALIDKEIDRIARLVHQTLDLYRPEAEPACRLRVDRTVQEVVAMLEPLCRASEVELTVALPQEPVEAWLPEGPVRQVIFNLLENALEASPRGGRVTVGITVANERLSLLVADQGPGIPVALSALVFEPFFTTKERSYTRGGVGLGLSVSRSLVQAMGGELTFESKPGQGTRFTVHLPLLIPEGMAAAQTG